MINGHGDDAWKYKEPIKADFSSNVYYGGLDKGLEQHLCGRLSSVTHYPEAGAQSLQEEAAKTYRQRYENVLVTNGATEAIYLLAMAFRHLKTVTLFTPSFSEYADACHLHDWAITYRPWDDLLGPIHVDTKLLLLCNPNNPTGQTLRPEKISRLCADHPGCLIVVDESYIRFSLHTQSMIGELDKHPNLLILRSLTKTCRIPGLRVGFAVGAEELVERMKAVRMPWSVNRLAIEAGLYIFRHAESFRIPLQELLKATQTWRHSLQDATGWTTHDTHTHYFLMETPGDTTASALKQRLVSRYGLLIRDAANFKGLTPVHFRVACQSPEDNRLLTQALRECSQAGF